MKKRIQKYLAGEREGFSLVELIIVIAIMAILIGVIALAVIPNIQRSRESKDLSTLDSVLSGLNVSAANFKLKDAINPTKINDTLTATSPNAWQTEVQKNLGTAKQTLSSSAATNGTSADIYYSITIPADGKAVITVWAGGNTVASANTTNYDSSEASKFLVQN